MSMGYGEDILCGFGSDHDVRIEKELEVQTVSIELEELPRSGQCLEFEIEGQNFEIELNYTEIRALQNDGFTVKFPHQGKILAVSVTWNV